MKFAHYSLGCLLTLGAAPAAADTLTDLLPPDTKVVFGIRVHNLALSSAAQAFAAQAQAATAGWLKTVPLDGIDLLRDIDEVLIASSGNGQNPPSVILVTGRFDVAHIAEGAERYHGVPLLIGESESDSAVALLENGTAIIGAKALVRAVIDQRWTKNRIDPALNDRITSLRQRYDIWGLGERPEGIVSPIPESKMLESKVLESIDRFQFGMQLASGLELRAEIHARSSKDSEKLNATLGMIAALLKGHQSASGSTFDLQTDGGTIKLAVSISDADLKKAIAAKAPVHSPVTVPSTTPVFTTPETTENGPNVAPEPAPVAPATPPAQSTAPAPPKSTHAPAQETDTVIFKLPGKK